MNRVVTRISTAKCSAPNVPKCWNGNYHLPPHHMQRPSEPHPNPTQNQLQQQQKQREEEEGETLDRVFTEVTPSTHEWSQELMDGEADCAHLPDLMVSRGKTGGRSSDGPSRSFSMRTRGTCKESCFVRDKGTLISLLASHDKGP